MNSNLPQIFAHMRYPHLRIGINHSVTNCDKLEISRLKSLYMESIETGYLLR